MYIPKISHSSQPKIPPPPKDPARTCHTIAEGLRQGDDILKKVAPPSTDFTSFVENSLTALYRSSDESERAFANDFLDKLLTLLLDPDAPSFKIAMNNEGQYILHIPEGSERKIVFEKISYRQKYGFFGETERHAETLYEVNVDNWILEITNLLIGDGRFVLDEIPTFLRNNLVIFDLLEKSITEKRPYSFHPYDVNERNLKCLARKKAHIEMFRRIDHSFLTYFTINWDDSWHAGRFENVKSFREGVIPASDLEKCQLCLDIFNRSKLFDIFSDERTSGSAVNLSKSEQLLVDCLLFILNDIKEWDFTSLNMMSSCFKNNSLYALCKFLGAHYEGSAICFKGIGYIDEFVPSIQLLLKNPKLTSMSFKDCPILGCLYNPGEILDNAKLKEFNVVNSFGVNDESAMDSLLAAIEANSTLEKVDFSYNNMSISNVLRLIRHRGLTSLNLAGNKFTKKQYGEFYKALKQNKKLLSFNFGTFSDKNFEVGLYKLVQAVLLDNQQALIQQSKRLLLENSEMADYVPREIWQLIFAKLYELHQPLK